MPLYQQVAEKIRERIESGELQLGHAVPSEAQIVAEFGVARITARGAIAHLRDEGLIHTIQGQGSFVGPPETPRVPRTDRLYERIAADLIERIRAGELQPDLPIPSETTLMQEYEVSKGTARKAAEFLRELGWVYTVPHRGTYAKQPGDWPAGA